MVCDLSNGLVALYKFSNNGNDSSGNGNNGTVVGATFVNDKNSVALQALNTDGINDYFDTSLKTWTDEMTIIRWIKTTETASRINGLFDSVTSLFQYYLNNSGNDGETQLFLRSSTGNDFICRFTDTGINDGTYHMIAFVIKQTTKECTAFVDKVPQTITNLSTGTPNLTSTARSFYIGARNNIGVADQFHAADHDEWRFYNRQLTVEELDALFDGYDNPVCPVVGNALAFGRNF